MDVGTLAADGTVQLSVAVLECDVTAVGVAADVLVGDDPSTGSGTALISKGTQNIIL